MMSIETRAAEAQGAKAAQTEGASRTILECVIEDLEGVVSDMRRILSGLSCELRSFSPSNVMFLTMSVADMLKTLGDAANTAHSIEELRSQAREDLDLRDKLTCLYMEFACLADRIGASGNGLIDTRLDDFRMKSYAHIIIDEQHAIVTWLYQRIVR